MKTLGMMRAGEFGAGLAAALAGAAWAGEYRLSVDRVTIGTGDFTRSGIGYMGPRPAPSFASGRARR